MKMPADAPVSITAQNGTRRTAAGAAGGAVVGADSRACPRALVSPLSSTADSDAIPVRPYPLDEARDREQETCEDHTSDRRAEDRTTVRVG